MYYITSWDSAGIRARPQQNL